DAAMGMEKDTAGLEVNLGYNHPVVMKKRLTKELETAKKQAEEAKAEHTKAQQALEAAKKNAEAASGRVAEIEKELKETDAAAGGKPAEKDAKPQTAKADDKAKAEEKAKADAKAKAEAEE